MAISWYPGHMHKAKKEMIKIIDQVDLLVEVLDARTPIASSNPLLAEISAGLPRIQILNKCDLAEDNKTQQWLRHFTGKADHHCLLSSKDRPINAEQIVRASKQLLKSQDAQRINDEIDERVKKSSSEKQDEQMKEQETADRSAEQTSTCLRSISEKLLVA